MNILIWTMFIALIVSAVLMIVLVLMQSVKASGMGAAFGGGTDSFFAKNESKTRDGRLKFLTKIVAVLMAVLCIALVIILSYTI